MKIITRTSPSIIPRIRLESVVRRKISEIKKGRTINSPMDNTRESITVNVMNSLSEVFSCSPSGAVDTFSFFPTAASGSSSSKKEADQVSVCIPRTRESTKATAPRRMGIPET